MEEDEPGLVLLGEVTVFRLVLAMLRATEGATFFELFFCAEEMDVVEGPFVHAIFGVGAFVKAEASEYDRRHG